MKVALIAAGCMFFQDILEIAKAQGAARNRGWVVAFSDTLFYFVQITGTTIAAFTLHGSSTANKVWVLGLVTLANIFGNLSGTWIGKRFIRDHSEESQDLRIQQLETRIAELENK